MTYPVDLGTLNVYMGNPYTLTLVFEGVDYTNKTFRSQIRTSPSDENVKTEWAISTPILVDGTDTQITMVLTGDPALGTNTGQTRQIGPGRTYFDVERLGGGIPEETMATGIISATQDVTR